MNVYIKTDDSYHIFTSESKEDPVKVEKTIFYLGVKNPLVPLGYDNAIANSTLEYMSMSEAAAIVIGDLFDGIIHFDDMFMNIYSDK